ncbi:hypothetical protein HDV00_004969 [Rhizophlyctis rosea]|nr:hypothetical protein HDV00_004969 [Rhizophlyctis rosea]
MEVVEERNGTQLGDGTADDVMWSWNDLESIDVSPTPPNADGNEESEEYEGDAGAASVGKKDKGKGKQIDLDTQEDSDYMPSPRTKSTKQPSDQTTKTPQKKSGPRIRLVINNDKNQSLPSSGASAVPGGPSRPKRTKRAAPPLDADEGMEVVVKRIKGWFCCEDCGGNFPTSASLEGHRLVHGGGGKNYACRYPGCKRQFPRADQMLTHYGRMHQTDAGGPSSAPPGSKPPTYVASITKDAYDRMMSATTRRPNEPLSVSALLEERYVEGGNEGCGGSQGAGSAIVGGGSSSAGDENRFVAMGGDEGGPSGSGERV